MMSIDPETGRVRLRGEGALGEWDETSDGYARVHRGHELKVRYERGGWAYSMDGQKAKALATSRKDAEAMALRSAVAGRLVARREQTLRR